MIGERDKYRTEIFKIAGFALMSPVGKYIMEISNPQINIFSTRSIVFFIIAMLLFYFGIMLILKGYETAS